MVLGLDASRMAGPRTGVGRYLEYLLGSWSTEQMPFERVELFSPAPLSGLPNGSRFHVSVLPSRGPGGWWQTTRLRPRAAGVDLLFAPYTIPPGYRGASVVSNLGILEGRHRMPGARAKLRSQHFAYSARHADAVIANSETTKAGLVEHFGVRPNKVTVIWPGVDTTTFRPAVAGEEQAEGPPYLLYVGKLSLRRHVPELLEAFAEVAAGRPDLQLVFVGPNAGSVPLDEIVTRLGIEAAVTHVEHLDQGELATLYRGALGFVLPTAQEGFSATILEALASGCPVLTVEHSALSEAGLDQAALTVPDARRETLAAGLKRLVDDEPERARLRAAGPRHASGFSWQETAAKTMDVLAEVARR